MWGAPGTMLAARAMLDRTGEERWAEAWRASAEEPGAGATRRPLDAAALGRRAARSRWRTAWSATWPRFLGGGDLLSTDRRDASPATAALCARGSARGGTRELARQRRRRLEAEDGEIRLQWCYGGVGIVATAAPYLDAESPARRRRADLGRPTDTREGLEHLPRDGQQRLRLPQGLRAHRRRALARARRRFAVHALAQVERVGVHAARALLALDWRSRGRRLRRRLPRRPRRVPDPRRLGVVAARNVHCIAVCSLHGATGDSVGR